PGGIPAKRMGAVRPPTVTVTDCTGWGVTDAGAPPSATAGDTAPAPVKYSVAVSPLSALALPAGAPLASVKMPGATAATTNETEADCPLLFSVSVALELAWISYGICRLIWPGDTYQRGAIRLLTVAETPTSCAGSGTVLAANTSGARLEPKMVSSIPGEYVGL